MSLGYADRLTKGVWKGKCGLPEEFDSDTELDRKIKALVTLIQNSTHLVAYTGAGISTPAGISDFRGPKGVWTREEQGEDRLSTGTSFGDANPTITHMALVALHKEGILKHVVTQNVDNLHLKSGLPRCALSELHGNVFMEKCEKCSREYIGSKELPTIGFKYTGNTCECGGRMRDVILDWNDALPDSELNTADEHSKKADLALCLGTSLQIVPACNLPIKATRKHGKAAPGKLVIVNLQRTPKDRHADLIIHGKCDDVMTRLMNLLNVNIPQYELQSKRSLNEESSESVPCKKLKSEH